MNSSSEHSVLGDLTAYFDAIRHPGEKSTQQVVYVAAESSEYTFAIELNR